jgi:hypothetical protein
MDSINENNNEALSNEISELKQEKSDMELKAYNHDVRTDICNKKIRIVKNDEKYIVSCNSSKSDKQLNGEVIKGYIFPGSLNIRQTIKKHFKKIGQTPKFSKDESPKLYEFIESLEPK